MASPPSRHGPRDISAIMRTVRSTDTTPEQSFREALSAKGLRFEVYPKGLPGNPDLAFPASKLVVFIDGDFWHGGQWLKRHLTTLEDQFKRTTSKDYWIGKIRRNMDRDCRATAALLSQGWIVLRFWESDVCKNLEWCVNMTLEVVEHGTQPGPIALLPQRSFADFFAGIGLMRMGLERQGWTVAFANDIDLQKYEMYKGHLADAEIHYMVEDVHAISANSVPTVSLATASFPCNDLSLAGARKGLDGKQSSAFWGFVRILEQLDRRRPPLVLLENVAGFLNSHGGNDFKQALLALNNLGYTVDSFMLDAARFVPQSRPRLFVVGVVDTRIETPQGELELLESDVRPKALCDFILTHPEIRWRIRRLPAQPESDKRLESILEDLPESAPEWWDSKRAQYLLNQMSARHRKIADAMIGGAEWSYGTVFRRMRNGKSMGELRTDGFAGCLRTPRGGSGRQILFKAGKGEYHARLVTPREAARLMGADEYQISVPLNQALFGFGDAVCVPVIEWIAKHYLNPSLIELIRGRPLELAVEEARI